MGITTVLLEFHTSGMELGILSRKMEPLVRVREVTQIHLFIQLTDFSRKNNITWKRYYSF